jgi:hypothetical protein
MVTIIDITVTKILNTNAKVLIFFAPLRLFFFLRLRQTSEKIRGIKPGNNPPRNILIIDHANQSLILLTSADGTIGADAGAGAAGANGVT